MSDGYSGSKRDVAADNTYPWPAPLTRWCQSVVTHQGPGQVDTASAGGEHALDQFLDLGGGEHQVGELVTAVAGREDTVGGVDPDLLDGRIVEQRLEGPEPGDPRHQLGDEGLEVADRGDGAGHRTLVVLAHQLGGHPAHRLDLALRVDTRAADRLAQTAIEQIEHVGPGGHATGRSGDAPLVEPWGRRDDGHEAPEMVPSSVSDHQSRPVFGLTNPGGAVVEEVTAVPPEK